MRIYRFSTVDTNGDEEVMEISLAEVLEALDSIGLRLPEQTSEATLYRDIVTGAAVLRAVREQADRTGLQGQELLMSTLRARHTTLERERDSEVAEKFAHAVGLPSRLGRRQH